jgi:mono/diheme cytochrome c family protein
MNRQIILAAALAAMSFGAIQAQAQTQRSILDGVYTDAQAARGAQQYATRCLVCHGAALEGNTLAPPLTGRFIADWAGMNLGDLFDNIALTMPLYRPGSVERSANADILAYILKVNAYPAGPRELSAEPEALKAIRFDAWPMGGGASNASSGAGPR